MKILVLFSQQRSGGSGYFSSLSAVLRRLLLPPRAAAWPPGASIAMHFAQIKRNLHIFAKDRNGIRGGKNTYSDRTRTSNGGKVVFAFLSNPPD